MSLPSLKYIEWQKGRQDIPITFNKICPDSSSTKRDQTTTKKGMSIVAFFSYLYKKRIRIKIINKMHDLNYGFVPTTNLHCTFLTITSKESFTDSSPYFNELIQERIKRYKQVKKITKRSI